jgi:hypothetical protein
MAGMSCHHIPKDDAWKQAHLAMLVRLGERAWLHCDDCRHSIMIEPRFRRVPCHRASASPRRLQERRRSSSLSRLVWRFGSHGRATARCAGGCETKMRKPITHTPFSRYSCVASSTSSLAWCPDRQILSGAIFAFGVH